MGLEFSKTLGPPLHLDFWCWQVAHGWKLEFRYLRKLSPGGLKQKMRSLLRADTSIVKSWMAFFGQATIEIVLNINS